MSGKVFDELTCPDCGGRVGLAPGETAPAGLKPCSCFAEKPAPRQRLPDEPDPEDMRPLVPNADGKKLCRICGKDLTGRSRLKDSHGYICKKCSDAEFEADAERDRDAIQCPECHRKLKAQAFVEWRGGLICRRCHAHHLENDKLKVPKVELRQHDKYEKHRLMTLSMIAGVIGLALMVKTFIIGW